MWSIDNPHPCLCRYLRGSGLLRPKLSASSSFSTGTACMRILSSKIAAANTAASLDVVGLRSLIPHSMIWAQNNRLLYLVTMSRLKRGRCRLYVSDGVHSGLSLRTGCVNSLNLVKSVLGTFKISQVQSNPTGYSRKQLGTVKPNRVQSKQCWTQIYVVTETHLATQQNIADGVYFPLVHFITFRHKKHKSF